MELNQAPVRDVRKVMTGTNGMVYDQEGNALVSIMDFQAQASITNASYQPLGTFVERSLPTSAKVTITFTEVIVQSGLFFQQIMEGMRTGIFPYYNFRGVMKSPYDDSEEQVVYRDCVPDGTIDIQNMTTGEIYKRSWSFVCNQVPDLQSALRNG